MITLTTHIRTVVAGGALLAMTWSASADLVIPGADGSDGAFAPTESVEIDLSLAPTATWDTPGGGNGVYDPTQWAVVFKYSSVNIPEGVTVTFRNHDSRAAVVWLVSGDVNIAGDVILDGENWQAAPLRAEPGPGGYRGGVGYLSISAPRGGGLGVGGGHNYTQGGNYATRGVSNSYPTYGNVRVLPLVGGSGGGSDDNGARGGAAGGGAILLAAAGTLTLNGSISAQGGDGSNNPYTPSLLYAGAGAGGAIRVIAESISGSGALLAKGGPTVRGGDGRIRIEAWYSDAEWSVSPAARVMPPDDPVLLWLPDGAPTVEIKYIASAEAPDDPRAHLGVGQEDVTLGILGGPADITVETHNVDTVDGIVEVRLIPEHGEAYPMVQALYQSGDYSEAIWVATTELPTGYFTVQAHSVNPAP